MESVKRTKFIVIKATEEEHEKIKRLARSCGMTVSTFVRSRMIDEWSRYGGTRNDGSRVQED